MKGKTLFSRSKNHKRGCQFLISHLVSIGTFSILFTVLSGVGRALFEKPKKKS